jgi:alpha-D-ribose 1-methylphosphonate 5-triphosphate synthase subunit PhnL
MSPIDNQASAPLKLKLEGVSKHFFLHQRSDQALQVLQNVNVEVRAGECVALDGSSGMGKSSILKMIFGNYLASSGHIWVKKTSDEWVDVAHAPVREVLQLRANTINYVSQFLRIIPRIGAFDLVKQEALFHTHTQEMQSNSLVSLPALPISKASEKELDERVAQMLERLHIAPRLWHLPPSTFSGGEQQRINLAKSLINPKPVLLLDEPSASLDLTNAEIVIDLINAERRRGAAILGIFHDIDVKNALMTRSIPMSDFQPQL